MLALCSMLLVTYHALNYAGIIGLGLIDTFCGTEKEKGRYRRMKRKTMAQWMNLHRNNNFVNQMRLPLLCEKSGAILLVLVGLTVDWQSDW